MEQTIDLTSLLSNINKTKKRVYITGLTACGKTKLSIALAQHFKQAEIINSDSLQFYKVADIMTATASSEEQDGVPHHLLSFLDVQETNFNVNKFIEEADKVTESLFAKNSLPIIVGGTNYYSEALIYQNGNPCTQENVEEEVLSKRENPEEDGTTNQKIDASIESKDFPSMLALLKELEPSKTHFYYEGDLRKVENALLRIRQGKSSNYSWSKKINQDFVMLVLNNTNKDWLETRIKKRIKEMICDEGGLQECFRVLFRITSHQTRKDNGDLLDYHLFQKQTTKLQEMTSFGVLQAIGYKEFIPTFQKEVVALKEDDWPEFEEKLVKKADEIVKGERENPEFYEQINKLAKDTIMLTKKQKKWLRGRIHSDKKLNHRSFEFYVENKQQFFKEIVPVSIKIIEDFLAGKSYEELNSKYADQKREDVPKNEKINFGCEYCDRNIVTQIEKDMHLKSKKHLKNKKRVIRGPDYLKGQYKGKSKKVKEDGVFDLGNVFEAEEGG